MRDMEHGVANWAALPDDLFGPVVSRLNLVEDFMALRGVCKSWRAAAATNKDKFVCKVPLLMLAEKDETDEREFYSLSKRKVCVRIPVPEAMGKRCFDVGFGWLLALSCTDEGEACLLNPFSSARIPLPNYTKIPKYKSIRHSTIYHFIRRGWLTANPSETVNFSLMAVMGFALVFWRNGDSKWTRIKPQCCSPIVTYMRGKICLLDLKGHVLIWDPKDLRIKPKGLIFDVAAAPNSFSDCMWQDYLVGSTTGELLLIRRIINALNPRLAKCFKVMRIDPVERKCIQVNDLGKDAVFLGDNAPICVDATQFPGVVKPNHIYFTDDRSPTITNTCTYAVGKDMGIYSLQDTNIQSLDVESLSPICPPIWLFPSF